MIQKVKFVIVSSRQGAGGSIVLHKLCLTLQELGYDSKIFYSPTFHDKNRYLYYLKYIKFLIHDTKKSYYLGCFHFILKTTQDIKVI